MDLITLTDEELDQHRIDVATEQERRAALESIPPQVAALAEKYRSGGGDTATLDAAIQPDQ